MLREDELELAAGYALETLDPTDREQVERRLAAGHPELERAIDEFRDAAALLAHATPSSAPPVGLRQRVLDAARSDMGLGSAPTVAATPRPAARATPAASAAPRPRAAGGSPNHLVLGVGAAAVVFAIASVALFAQTRSLGARVAALDSQMRGLEANLVQINETNRWGEVWRARNVRVAAFGYTGAARLTAEGRVAYDPASRRAVVMLEQLQSHAGQDFELWAIKDGRPVSLGLVRPDGSGRAEIRLTEVGNASELGGFSLSIEQAGGSGDPNSPGGPMVLVARLPG